MKIISLDEMIEKTYGKKETAKRDEFEQARKFLELGIILRQEREKRNISKEELAKLIGKKKNYITRIENNAGYLSLKNLFEIVEKGLGGKVHIKIDF